MDERATDRERIRAALEQVRAASEGSAERACAPRIPGYRLERELFRGGQGVVYLGVQETTGQEVAVKVMREEWGSSSARARFEREIGVLASLRHKNLVAIHDRGLHEGRAYYVMEYVAGRDLDQELAARERSLREEVELLARVCEAVGAAHLRGVLHRDLKPQNVRIDEDGEPRLLDFGLAKWMDAEGRDLTTADGFVGTACWASPEQVGGEPLDLRSDVYSLGVLLYHGLTGSFPYDVSGPLARVFQAVRESAPRPARRLRAEIDADLETILATALAKEPERRYQSALELASDLRRWLAGRPIVARGESALYALRMLVRRHKAASAALALVLLVLLGSALSVAESRARWRSLAGRLEAKLHAERLRGAASALEEGAGARAQELLAAIPPERDDWPARHLRRFLERERWRFAPAERRLIAAAFSPDESRIALGSWQGDVWLLGARDGAVAWHDERELAEVRALAFTPGGRELIALASDGLVFFDAERGDVLRRAPWPEGGLELLSLSAEHVFAAGSGGDVVRFSPLGEPLASFRCGEGAAAIEGGAPREGIVWTAIHAASARVATAGSGAIRCWDALTGELLCVTQLAGLNPEVGLCSLAFSPDGERLALGANRTGTAPGSLLLFDARDGARLALLENLEASPAPLALLASGESWVGAAGGSARRVDPASGLTLELVARGGRTPDLLVPAPSGGLLAVLAEGASLWETERPEPPASAARRPLALALAPDGERWIAHEQGAGGLVLSTGSAGPALALELGARAPDLVALDPGHERVAAAWSSGRVLVLSLAGGAERREWELGLSPRALAFQDGALLVAAADGALLRLDPGLAGARHVLAAAPGPRALAATQARLAVAGERTLELFRAEGTRSFSAALELLPGERIQALSFLDPDELLAVATGAGRILLVDLAGGETLCTLPLRSRAIRALAFDREREELVALTDDGALHARRAARAR